MRRFLPFALIALVIAALLTGRAVRTQIGVEYSAAALQSYILSLGALAPPIFLTIMTFRQFLFLPSVVVLTAGGLVFGTALGTGLGGVGILLSAMLMFTLARGVARGWVRTRFGQRFRHFEQQADASGPIVLAIATAHPMGPLSPMHWAAGISGMRWYRFALAIALAGFVRAYIYSAVGATLLDIGSQEFYTASLALLVVALLPLLHGGIRAKVLGRGSLSTRSRRAIRIPDQ
jgi:uncharacterized membrane protein YdjX (TVP38/TMEM64 family)